MNLLKPTTALLGTLYVGTDRLERPLTEPEKKDLSAHLRKHDFVGASMVSLRFAYSLRRSRPAAQDLQGRANLRLTRQGWDPGVVTLVKCLCRFVWSEHTHEKRESVTARKAEEIFLREQGIDGAAPSAEDQVTRLEAEQQEEARAKEQIDSLRASFVAARDEINLLWLDYRLAGVVEPSEMARLSGRDVGEFYRAAERRKRQTARLLAAQGGAKFEEKQVMSERKHADLWRELVDEAGEDEIDRAANVSVAEAEDELRAAGFDVAAERAKAGAFLDGLGTAGSTSTSEQARPAEAPPRLAEATRRKRPRPATLWLAAAATFAVAGGAVYATLHPSHEVVSKGHPPAPSTPAPVVPSVDDLVVAADLRGKAAAACDAKQWSVCLAELDEARAVDPGGDDASSVKSLRDQAIAGILAPR